MCWLPPSHAGGHLRSPDKQEQSGEWPCHPCVLADTFQARTGSGNRSYGPGGNRTTPEASRRGGLGPTLLLLGSLRNPRGVRNRHVGTCSLGPGGGVGVGLGRGKRGTLGSSARFQACARFKKSQVGGEGPTDGRGGVGSPSVWFPGVSEGGRSCRGYSQLHLSVTLCMEPSVCPHFPCSESHSPGRPHAISPPPAPETVTPVPPHFPVITPCTYSTPVTLASFLLQTY